MTETMLSGKSEMIALPSVGHVVPSNSADTYIAFDSACTATKNPPEYSICPIETAKDAATWIGAALVDISKSQSCPPVQITNCVPLSAKVGLAVVGAFSVPLTTGALLAKRSYKT